MRIKSIILAGLMAFAMTGVSHAGKISQIAAHDHLYTSINYVQYSDQGLGPVNYQACPITPGDRAEVIGIFRPLKMIKLHIQSGEHKGCKGWTWAKNYRD